MKRALLALCLLLGGATVAIGQASSLYGPPDPADLVHKNEMPGAASVAPPATSTDSAAGTSMLYARADHTHATSVQRARMTVAPAGQSVRWTFAKPYEAGVVPVVTCTAQNVPGATRPFVVNTVGDPTSTYADLAVFQAAQPTVALLGVNLTLFGAAGAGTIVNCQAAKPTQVP